MIYSKYSEAEKEEQNENELLQFKINYVDHVSSGDSKQDWKAALFYFEAIILYIKRALPHVTELCLQVDNAKCCKSPCLIMLMFILGKHHGITIILFIHAGV